ncbi:hypothetical protein ASPCAL00523 [Aspergillus calidoustus]|uniref:HTH CENPB-type domain-containing protein n=1 Tax=Aspergillus calidoustus TaxID=454130 RepID=A0A0U5FNT4_ASPCI|nr:hypothetical protein ASPCAL00523 [Aspergillus calidoustus]
MPPKPRQSLQNLVEQEGRIQLAIQALKKREISSARRAAEVFNVPRSTLRDRLKGHGFQPELRNHSFRLSENQEEALVKWIIDRDTRGVAPKVSHVQQMAYLVLQEGSSTPPKPLGKNWVTSFIKRHESIKSRFARKYNCQRALCEDPRAMREWFDNLKALREENGIQLEDIYNFDETGFAMGQIATTRVVTRAEILGKPYIIQPGQREWVTSIECIGSTGFVVPPCIIFKGKVHIEGWFEELGLPADWRIELSANGWTTDQITLRWLEKCFIPYTTERTIGSHRLLVLDGHGSHLTPDFDKVCRDNKIICICMPAHSSHLLQPLDVGCFGPLKRAYGGLVEAKMRLGFHHIDKHDFLQAYPEARQRVFTKANIQSGFRATGIEPYDPQEVLKRFNYTISTPTPPPSQGGASTSSSTLATPYTARQLHKKASSVKKLLDRGTYIPSTPSKRAIDELIKGCELAIYNTAFTLKELNDLRAESQVQQLKRGRSKRQMAPVQGLQVQEARDLITLRNEQSNNIDGGGGEAIETTPITLAPRKRAPPTCSECNIQGHIRTRCPNRRAT